MKRGKGRGGEETETSKRVKQGQRSTCIFQNGSGTPTERALFEALVHLQRVNTQKCGRGTVGGKSGWEEAENQQPLLQVCQKIMRIKLQWRKHFLGFQVFSLQGFLSENEEFSVCGTECILLFELLFTQRIL